MSKNDYFDEEELMKFISEVEEHSMVEAPFYMKEKILDRVREESRQTDKSVKNRSSRIELFQFSLKVACVTAAAIAVLLFTPSELPVPTWKLDISSVQTNDFSNQLKKSSYRFSNLLTRFSNQVIGKEELKNEKEKKK